MVSASAPNYFTFLGEIEECQGTIAEDEAEDIGYDREKRKILKTGYASGGCVLKVDLTYGRTQGSFLTYGMKWLAMEDHQMINGGGCKVSIALEKQTQTTQPTPNRELEQIAYYLLHEIQNEIDKGSKVADEILYRAFARLEKDKAKN